jgi:hypothetical protein
VTGALDGRRGGPSGCLVSHFTCLRILTLRIAGSRDGDKSQRAGLRLALLCNDTMTDGGSHEHHVSTELRNADQPEW